MNIYSQAWMLHEAFMKSQRRLSKKDPMFILEYGPTVLNTDGSSHTDVGPVPFQARMRPGPAPR